MLLLSLVDLIYCWAGPRVGLVILISTFRNLETPTIKGTETVYCVMTTDGSRLPQLNEWVMTLLPSFLQHPVKLRNRSTYKQPKQTQMCVEHGAF